jgi:hypothetical protein
VWCKADVSSVRLALLELDELMPLRLRYADGYESSGSGEPVSGSSEPGSPSPAHDDLDDLLEWLTVWETEYRKSQRFPAPPYRGATAPALTTCLAWLCGQLDRILAHVELGEGFGLGVLSWHARLSGATHTGPPKRQAKPLRCPSCHLATLTQVEGEDKIECVNPKCEAGHLTVAEYEHRVEQAAKALSPTRQARLPHATIQPAAGDSQETQTAGNLGVSRGIRIDPDTRRLVFEQPYREPVPPGEFARLPWPACPDCGRDIVVDYVLDELPGKEPVIVGAKVLTEVPARLVAKATSWRCSGGTCTAGGSA